MQLLCFLATPVFFRCPDVGDQFMNLMKQRGQLVFLVTQQIFRRNSR
jgi:hypothetical protein